MEPMLGLMSAASGLNSAGGSGGWLLAFVVGICLSATCGFRIFVGGGGAAAIVQTGTVALRGASTASTGGTGNFVVSTIELGAAALLTVLAIVAKIVCLIAVIAIGLAVIGRCRPWKIFKRSPGTCH